MTQRHSVAVDETTHKIIDKEAKKNLMTLGNFVKFLVKEYCKKKKLPLKGGK